MTAAAINPYNFRLKWANAVSQILRVRTLFFLSRTLGTNEFDIYWTLKIRVHSLLLPFVDFYVDNKRATKDNTKRRKIMLFFEQFAFSSQILIHGPVL